MDIDALLAGLIPVNPNGQTGGQTGGGPTTAIPPQPGQGQPPPSYEQLLAAMGLNTLPDRNAQLGGQIQRAQGMAAGGRAEKRSSPMGALLGGLGDVAGGIGGTLQENDLRGQMNANFDKEDQGTQVRAGEHDRQLMEAIMQILATGRGSHAQDTEALAAPVPF